MELAVYRSLLSIESRLLRRLMYQLYQPPKMATASTSIPTPAPIPALAPVERPLLPPPVLACAATVGVVPGVLVKEPTETMVVAGTSATTTEVTVE